MPRLPHDVQQQVQAGSIPRTSGYELSKLGNEKTQRNLAEQAASGALNHKQTSKAVRQRRGKPVAETRGIRQVFLAENNIKVTVTANRKGNYHEVEEALEQALEEVRLRIKSNIQLNF